MTHPVGIVVFEKTPYWGPELKRQFAGQSVLVRECRSVHDVIPAAASWAVAVAVIVLDAAPAECLAWIGNSFQSQSRMSIVVVASSELAALEWPLREAGVDGFVDDEIAGDHLARICLRRLRQREPTARVAAP